MVSFLMSFELGLKHSKATWRCAGTLILLIRKLYIPAMLAPGGCGFHEFECLDRTLWLQFGARVVLLAALHFQL